MKLLRLLLIILIVLLLAGCFPTPTIVPTPTQEFFTPEPTATDMPIDPTPTPPPLEGQQLAFPALNRYPFVPGDPRLNLQLTWSGWYGGASEKPPGQITGAGWSTVDFRGWPMTSANLVPKVPSTTQSPWNLLHIMDRYGDLHAQGMQCEYPATQCILYLQNQGPNGAGIPYRAGDSFDLGIEWNNVTLDRMESGGGSFPVGLPWSGVETDPIRVRILLLRYEGGIPLYDSAASIGWQDCQTIAAITGKPTCEPIDTEDNPILITLEDTWTADETHCDAGETCLATFRVEYLTNSDAIGVSELWLHSAWFEPR